MQNEPKTLLEWCEFSYTDNAEFASIDIEKLFISQCKHFINSRLEHGFSDATYKPIKKPDISIVEEMRFGAQAFVDDSGRDIIKINQGTLSFILWMSFKCLMHPSYPFPGEPEEKGISRKSIAGKGTSAITNSWDIPSAPLARAFGIQLAFHAFLFVLFHELGHLAQGHCRYLSGKKFLDFGEDENEESALNNPARRAMEYMADLFATRELMYYTRSVSEELYPSAIEEGGIRFDQEAKLNVIDRARYLCSADPLFLPLSFVTVLGIVFSLTSSGGKRHPKSSVRHLASARASTELMSSILGVKKNTELGLKMLTVIIILVAEVGGRAMHSDDDVENLENILDTKGNTESIAREIKELHRQFSLIQHDLEKHDLAPHAFLSFKK